MDEIFGYFPPVAEPAVEAAAADAAQAGARVRPRRACSRRRTRSTSTTRGSSNAGTWFIGRLQTERDKQRVLDGLEGAAAARREASTARRMEQDCCAASGSRVFLMNNVHEDAPVVFESRWAMSYLRGPLTRGRRSRR